jgi:hypothetical protein
MQDETLSQDLETGLHREDPEKIRFSGFLQETQNKGMHYIREKKQATKILLTLNEKKLQSECQLTPCIIHHRPNPDIFPF